MHPLMSHLLLSSYFDLFFVLSYSSILIFCHLLSFILKPFFGNFLFFILSHSLSPPSRQQYRIVSFTKVFCCIISSCLFFLSLALSMDIFLYFFHIFITLHRPSIPFSFRTHTKTTTMLLDIVPFHTILIIYIPIHKQTFCKAILSHFSLTFTKHSLKTHTPFPSNLFFLT